jgi:hypothetical protein
MFSRKVLLSMAMLMSSLSAQAASSGGLYFSHHDWELACDNTRTCRAAGYSVDGDDMPVSVLLTRKAGPNQPVTVELAIGNYLESEALKKLPATFKLAMRIKGQGVGQVVMGQDSLSSSLSETQSAALLAALPKDSSIEWAGGSLAWHLSSKGASAVLLKMDEFQGRIGTTAALLKKGPKGEDAVLPPLPMPVLLVPALPKAQPGDEQFLKKHGKLIRKAVIAASKNDEDCEMLTAPQDGEMALVAVRLTDAKWLVSSTCWRAAYNSGDGYWIIDGSAPYNPVAVTTSGSEYSDGSIFQSQKGRGLGDCWSTASWSWDGKQFIQTAASTTGMCRLIAPGGAWALPTVVMDVKHKPR